MAKWNFALLLLLLVPPAAVHAAGQTDYVLASDPASEQAHHLMQSGSKIEKAGGMVGQRAEYYLCRTTPDLGFSPKNIALNKYHVGYPKASATSCELAGQWDTWGPIDGLVIDEVFGDKQSVWDCASTDTDPSWDLDFGKFVQIGSILFRTSVLYPIKDFDLLRWDDTTQNWDATPIASIRGNTAVNIPINNLNIGTQKLRVHTLRGPNSWPRARRIEELEVYPPAASYPFTPRWFSYDLAVPPSGTWTLEVQEVNDEISNGDRTCYDVLVDGNKIHTRDYSDTGPGLYTCFIDVPANGKSKVTVTFKDTSGLGMRIRSLRVYDDFMAYCQQNRYMVPLYACPRLGLFNNSTATGSTDLLDQWQTVFDAAGAGDKLGVANPISYSSQSTTTIQKHADFLGQLMVSRNLPMVFRFNSKWADTPSGMSDGLGGKFGDAKYHQIAYSNYDNYDDPGLKAYMDSCKPGWWNIHYGLTVPNMWANVPWLTYNNKTLNDYKAGRLQSAIAMLNPWYEQIEQQGKFGNVIGFITDGEPVYLWRGTDLNTAEGFSTVNGGVGRYDVMFDFNWSVVQDAAKDGIDLDPTDGLDDRERWWLHRNLITYSRFLVKTIRTNLHRPAITVNGDEVIYPKDDPALGSFLVGPGVPAYPLRDKYHPLFEIGIFEEGAVGIECRAPYYFLRGRELGRVASTDIECENGSNYVFARAAGWIQGVYEGGCRFVVLTNTGDPTLWAFLPQMLQNPTESMVRNRLESLLITWRRDALNLIEALKKTPGVDTAVLANASDMIRQGRYRDAFEEAMKARATAIPATYLVTSPGELKPFPITITAQSAPVTITVQGVGDSLLLQTQSAKPCRIRVKNLAPNALLTQRTPTSPIPKIFRANKYGVVEINSPGGRSTLERNNPRMIRGR